MFVSVIVRLLNLTYYTKFSGGRYKINYSFRKKKKTYLTEKYKIFTCGGYNLMDGEH